MFDIKYKFENIKSINYSSYVAENGKSYEGIKFYADKIVKMSDDEFGSLDKELRIEVYFKCSMSRVKQLMPKFLKVESILKQDSKKVLEFVSIPTSGKLKDGFKLVVGDELIQAIDKLLDIK